MGRMTVSLLVYLAEQVGNYLAGNSILGRYIDRLGRLDRYIDGLGRLDRLDRLDKLDRLDRLDLTLFKVRITLDLDLQLNRYLISDTYILKINRNFLLRVIWKKY